METTKKTEWRQCSKCGSKEKQYKNGHRMDGAQIFKCACRNHFYTTAPSKRYTEEAKQQAIKAYYSELSGRAVGKLFWMSKANII